MNILHPTVYKLCLNIIMNYESLTTLRLQYFVGQLASGMFIIACISVYANEYEFEY